MDSSVIPSFDIFRGRFGDKDVVWIEAVEGLATARERMEHFASQRPALTLSSVRLTTLCSR